jgi:hypothetical protein
MSKYIQDEWPDANNNDKKYKNGFVDDMFFCPSCLGNNIVVERHGLVCRNCGSTRDYGSILVCGSGSSGVLDSMLPIYRKNTYKARFYWNERMAQFLMREPLITPDDADALVDSFGQLERDGKIERRDGEYLKKSEVKKVINHAHLKTSKFLEKYLSIGFILTGVMPYEKPPSEELIRKMTDDFVSLLCLFQYNDRFGRHSMINYNLLIRELLARHGGSEYIHLFPELKTKTKLNKCMEIYHSMWMQILESEIISTLGLMKIKAPLLEDAQLDKREIAPRITAKSHLKRKYVDLRDGHTTKHCRLS